MTGLVRKATLLTACGLMLAAWASAGVPNPSKTALASTTCIATVGKDVATADPQTGILALVTIPNNRIVVRDVNDAPVAGSSVVVDFQPCNTTDIQVCSVQGQAGLSILCGGGFRNVTLSANPSGVAFFSIIGNSNNITGTIAGTTTACAKVYADGILVTTVKVASYDQDGTGGIGGADLFLFFQDQSILPGPSPAPSTRSDYDGDGTVGGADLFYFFTVQGPGASSSSCAVVDCVP
jgi:hypothetical protein